MSETLKELQVRLDALEKRYVGVWSRPKSYYATKELLEKQIKEYKDEK